jgi:SAM-dependent methyltransferase
MTGDLSQRISDEVPYFKAHALSGDVAIDLGCGHGIHSIALATAGFKVISIDFNETLLASLQQHSAGLPIKTVSADLTAFKDIVSKGDLIVCMGDTLAHLDSWPALGQLIRDCADVLTPDGKLVVSFRDYSVALLGDDRFIPVKSDDKRIMSCFLEYDEMFVNVTDIVFEKNGGGWQQKVSSYKKLRLTTPQVERCLADNGFTIRSSEIRNRMRYIIANRK